MSKYSTRLERSGSDVRAALREQVTLLIAYCENFDRGQQAFCKPMAASVRILLHQTGKSQSLLGQLKLRSGRFFSVAPPISPTNLLSECNLIGMHLTNQHATYTPRLLTNLDSRNRKPFPEWWVGAVAKAQDKRTMSRMDIVGAVADMDGGAHVDPGFTPLYHSFRNGEFLGWRFTIDDQEGSWISSPQYACIRTIAHELLLTLQKYAPWSFEKAYAVSESELVDQPSALT